MFILSSFIIIHPFGQTMFFTFFFTQSHNIASLHATALVYTVSQKNKDTTKIVPSDFMSLTELLILLTLLCFKE